jgi:hypothetical protein
MRPIRIEGDIAYVTLSQGKVAIIDTEYAEEVGNYNWAYHAAGYAIAHNRLNNNKQFLLHRLIMKPPIEKQIDHINSNGLDCRKCNMRLCNHSQNKMNEGLRSSNTSGFKGVSWNKARQKWTSQIKINYKNIHIGYYDEIKDAGQSYREAATKYFGDFANFGEETT